MGTDQRRGSWGRPGTDRQAHRERGRSPRAERGGLVDKGMGVGVGVVIVMVIVMVIIMVIVMLIVMLIVILIVILIATTMLIVLILTPLPFPLPPPRHSFPLVSPDSPWACAVAARPPTITAMPCRSRSKGERAAILLACPGVVGWGLTRRSRSDSDTSLHHKESQP